MNDLCVCICDKQHDEPFLFSHLCYKLPVLSRRIARNEIEKEEEGKASFLFLLQPAIYLNKIQEEENKKGNSDSGRDRGDRIRRTFCPTTGLWL